MKALVKSKAERGSELHQKLILISVKNTQRFFEFGEILKEIRDDELWETMGYSSFDDYFSDPELSISKSSVYHAISLVEHFPEWRTMSPVPISKLIMIVPHLTQENKPKLLEYATGLSKSDLRQELSREGLKNETGNYKALPKVYFCNECHLFKGIYHNELCSCGWTDEQKKKLNDLLKEVYEN